MIHRAHKNVQQYCILTFFIQKAASAAKRAALTSKNKSQTRMLSVVDTTTMGTYPQVVIYLLRTYAMDENIPNMKDDITRLNRQRKNQSHYAEELIAETLRYGDVLYRTWSQGDVNQETWWTHCTGHEGLLASRISTSLHDLTFYVTSLLNLKDGQQGLTKFQVGVRPQNNRTDYQKRSPTVKVNTSSETG